MPDTQPGEMTFTARMEDPEDMTKYPSWLQLEGRKDNPPKKRARQIYRTGVVSSREDSCVYCIGLKVPCIRGQGAKFGKCCLCTMKDFHPESVCHLEGQPEPDLALLKPTAVNKIKQVEKEIAKVQRQASQEESISEGGFGQFQTSLAVPTAAPSTSLSIPRSEPPRSMRSFAPSPEPASTQFGGSPFAAGPANSGSNAILERITVLENQVAHLEASLLALRVKIQEIESSVASTSTTLPPIADSASTASSITGRKLSIMEVQPSTAYTPSIRSPVTDDNPIRRPSTMNIHKIMNQSFPVGLPAGSALVSYADDSDGEVTPKHSVAHGFGSRPDDCICAHSDQAYDADSDMTDAN